MVLDFIPVTALNVVLIIIFIVVMIGSGMVAAGTDTANGMKQATPVLSAVGFVIAAYLTVRCKGVQC